LFDKGIQVDVSAETAGAARKSITFHRWKLSGAL
jgi:hypothetical protein